MRLRGFLISNALLFMALNTAKAAMPSNPVEDVGPISVTDYSPDADASGTLPLEPSPLIAEDKVLASAYYDTVSILSASNRCSDFFGGPAASVDIFNQMLGRMQKGYVSPAVGMKMSGDTVNVFNTTTRKAYRLFDKVTLNANGPFYRKRLSRAEPAAPRLGSFEPNTREARVLIFLHELGHVVRGSDGNWLLPNDGNDADLSRRNSSRIENICWDELTGLAPSEAASNLAKRRKAEEKFTPLQVTGPEL
jgi:hypothetical protein